MSENNAKKSTGLSGRFAAFSALSGRDKARKISDLLFNNAMFIIIFIAVIYIAVKVPAFLSVPSIVNII